MCATEQTGRDAPAHYLIVDAWAGREFNDAERKFVASGKVEAAARAAAPRTDAERQAMLAAEEEGKRRAKG